MTIKDTYCFCVTIDGFTLEGALWVIRARFQGNKAPNVRFSSYFRSDFKFGNETHTFLSGSSECCGRTNFFYG